MTLPKKGSQIPYYYNKLLLCFLALDHYFFSQTSFFCYFINDILNSLVHIKLSSASFVSCFVADMMSHEASDCFLSDGKPNVQNNSIYLHELTSL